MKTETPTRTKPVRVAERQFPKFTLFKVDPQWRRLDEHQKTATKQQFASIAKRFASRNALSGLKTFNILDLLG